MNKCYVKSLLLTAFVGAGALLPAADIDMQRQHDITLDSYKVDIKQYEDAANEYIARANECFIAGNYKDAAYNYVQARYVLETLKDKSQHFADQLEKVKEQIAKSYYYLAQQMAEEADAAANSNDLKKAIEKCEEAMVIYPACQKEMMPRKEKYEKMLASIERRASLSEDRVLGGQSDVDRKYQIAVLLKQARTLYYTRQYEQARKRYQEVLLLDKINPEAIQGLRATALQINKAGRDRYRLMHKKAMAEAAWKGAEPIIMTEERDGQNEKDEEGAMGNGIEKKQAQLDDPETELIRKKLAEIILPTVNISNTELPDVITYLNQQSKRFDPKQEGVNIILYYPEKKETDSMDGMAGAGNPDSLVDDMSADDQSASEEEDAFADEESETATAKNGPKVKYPIVSSVVLHNKSLEEVLKAICLSAKLKMKVEKNAVILAPEDAPLDDMQIKVFLFDASLVDELGGNDPESLQEGLSMRPGYKITFPVGSKVMYDERFRSLIVLNTPENLAQISDAVAEMRKLDPPRLVQIQVKFVEIEQNDLKELGFIQSLSRPMGDNGKTDGRLQFDKNDETIYNSGNNTFVYSRSTNGYNYNLTINAINQLDSKDVLSSPKVLTNDGEKVTIKMTSERYFEWDYEEGEWETSSSDGIMTYSYTPPWPEFEMQELGITMDVTPKVDLKNRLIELDMHPWVRTLVGWTEYQYTVSADDTDGGAGLGSVETMKRPIVAERTTLTNVQVADNETVVIGGIIKDYTTIVDDKIPILGDIPLLGNFFKSKSTSIKKTNLLIFVTARIIKPDGTPYFDTASTNKGRATNAGIGDIY